MSARVDYDGLIARNLRDQADKQASIDRLQFLRGPGAANVRRRYLRELADLQAEHAYLVEHRDIEAAAAERRRTERRGLLGTSLFRRT